MTNTGTFWTPEDLSILKSAWYNRPPAMRKSEFALVWGRILKKSADAIRGKLAGFEREGIPESHYKIWDDYPTITGDALILNDCHIPYHDADFINRCLAVARSMKITTTILGGDVLEANAFGHFPEDYQAEIKLGINIDAREKLESILENMKDEDAKDELSKLLDQSESNGNATDEIKEARKVLKALASATGEVIWIMGNHEQRIIRVMERSIPAKMMTELFMGDNPKWKVSNYYWCELNSGGELFRITHPVNTSKGSSKRLAPKYGAHIIMAHNHHFSIQTDPSGKFLAIEAGACVDRTRLPYEIQRDTGADAHITGAVIVRNGKPIFLNRFTDWDMLK